MCWRPPASMRICSMLGNSERRTPGRSPPISSANWEVRCRRAAPVSGSQTGRARSAGSLGSAKGTQPPRLRADVTGAHPGEDRARCERAADNATAVMKTRVGLVSGVAAQVLPRPVCHRSRAQVLISLQWLRPDGTVVDLGHLGGLLTHSVILLRQRNRFRVFHEWVYVRPGFSH